MKRIMAVLAIITTLFVAGCVSGKGQVMDGDGMIQTQQYTQINQEEANYTG